MSSTFKPLPFQSAKRERINSPFEKRWKTAKLLSLLAPIAISEIKNWKGSIKQKGDNNLIIPPISTSKKSSTKKLIPKREKENKTPRIPAIIIPSPKYSFSLFLSSLLANRTFKDEKEA